MYTPRITKIVIMNIDQNVHRYTVGSKLKPFISIRNILFESELYTSVIRYSVTIKKCFNLFILNNIYLWKIVVRLAIV